MIDKNIEIVFNGQIADGMYLMGLNAPEIVVDARPGQFVMIRVGPVKDPLLRRPFSIGGIIQGEILLILYKVVGRGTALMSAAAKGDRMTVLGPLGRGFSQPRPGRIPILAAGGIGIAPLVFLAQNLAESNLIFLAGYRCAAEIVPFEKVGLKGANVEIATDDGSAGFHGFVTDLLKERMHLEPEILPELYACGPVAMLKKVAALAIEEDTSCQMSLEANMACGLGACQGCALKSSYQDKLSYYLVCRDGPIFPARSIDWEAL
ncbi:dihydroorotate dehydrogenase electron transfer subunit [Thermodesulfobacteriota bacterium]